MALLSTQTVSYAGLTPSYAAANAGGDTFTPDADTFLHVKNASGGSLTVTVAVPTTVVGGQAVSSVAVSVGAGSEKMIGTFPANWFASSGVANITYSGVTSLTIAAIKASTPTGA